KAPVLAEPIQVVRQIIYAVNNLPRADRSVGRRPQGRTATAAVLRSAPAGTSHFTFGPPDQQPCRKSPRIWGAFGGPNLPCEPYVSTIPVQGGFCRNWQVNKGFQPGPCASPMCRKA